MLPPSSVRPLPLVSQTARSGRPLPRSAVPERDLLRRDLRADDRHERRLVLLKRDRFLDAVLEEIAESAPRPRPRWPVPSGRTARRQEHAAAGGGGAAGRPADDAADGAAGSPAADAAAGALRD